MSDKSKKPGLLERSIESAAGIASGRLEKRAVIYLRVSSTAQVNTDIERDGFSLPAQRSACTRKSESLGAEVIEEFVERGESGKSTLRRTALSAMLERIERGDIDFVVVHKVDRLARKRADDALILERIRATGARLVSVSENIDETPSGMLLHGIMASIAEFYSMNLAAEVLKGTTEKARRGGTPFRAPIGYLNVRETVEGREVRTIAVDPDRGPLVSELFQLYATGTFSLIELAAIMEAKGLNSPGTPKVPSRPLGHNRISKILNNPFYTGVVSYRGEVHDGRHPALVDVETFETVQKLLEAKRVSGERPSRHQHYLRGSLICGRCEGSLIYTRNRGNGGVYEYYTCMSAKRGECDLPHQRLEAIEARIEQLFERVELDDEVRGRIEAAVLRHLDERGQQSAPRLSKAEADLVKLKNQEKKLLDAHYADAISKELFVEEQARIRRERIAAEKLIERLSADDQVLRENVLTALAMTDRIQAAYIAADVNEKRLFNQAFFEWIAIDDEAVSDFQVAEPFDQFQQVAVSEEAKEAQPRRLAVVKNKTADLFSKVGGLNFDKMVEPDGIEPTTSCLQSRRSPN